MPLHEGIVFLKVGKKVSLRHPVISKYDAGFVSAISSHPDLRLRKDMARLLRKQDDRRICQPSMVNQI